MKKYHNVLIIVLLTILILNLLGCQKEPIKIGFIGDLSSKNSQLAIDARNAVEYYLDNLNAKGGINGSLVQLVIKDDESDTLVASIKHQEFVEEGVKVIIGHMTSSMSSSILTSADKELLFISPSMSTSTLTGIDDNFLRTSPLNDMQGITFVNYAIENSVDNLLIIYDQMNSDYTEPLAASVEQLFIQEGLSVVDSVGFDSRDKSIEELVESLADTKFDNILILAQATNTAYIIQSLSQTHGSFGKYSVSWSMTNDFITNGGHVVEGTIFIGTYEPVETSQRSQMFTKGFMERYSYEPTFISYLAYDAIDVLCEAINTTKEIEVEDIKEAIIKHGEYEGLNEKFYIDEFGDSTRKYLLYQLEKARFVPIR